MKTVKNILLKHFDFSDGAPWWFWFTLGLITSFACKFFMF